MRQTFILPRSCEISLLTIVIVIVTKCTFDCMLNNVVIYDPCNAPSHNYAILSITLEQLKT